MQQWNTKRKVRVAKVIHATIEELPGAVSSVRSVPAAACLCSVAGARKDVFSGSVPRLITRTIENIRGLNLAVVKLTTFQVTQWPL
jgi:hypothetical protein